MRTLRDGRVIFICSLSANPCLGAPSRYRKHTASAPGHLASAAFIVLPAVTTEPLAAVALAIAQDS